ncbi:MAG: diadenylate cyclase CdaA [Clostridiales bacterium]|nr:diadenylate cyclase CdaA [Clostridiales bacterium]
MPLSIFSAYFDDLRQAVTSIDGIGDILDILAVTVVIYFGIKLVKETKAKQLVIGVGSLIVFYVIATVLKMDAVKYLLSLIFSNLLLILIVVFTPEIRHALETIGHGSSKISISNLKNMDILKKNQMAVTIEQVVKACSNFSDKSIGALIVFERNTMLGDIIKTGTVIDAAITNQLIENIFFPKAALHDGAAIIRDGRLYAAGCILPLTQKNDYVSADLGTRHRAAIGISENSDALVVVVSEETGHISIAEKGNMLTNISVGQLREILQDNFVEQQNESKIRKILRGKNDEK